MWWQGGAGLTERSEQKSLSADATHDVFGNSFLAELLRILLVPNREDAVLSVLLNRLSFRIIAIGSKIDGTDTNRLRFRTPNDRLVRP